MTTTRNRRSPGTHHARVSEMMLRRRELTTAQLHAAPTLCNERTSSPALHLAEVATALVALGMTPRRAATHPAVQHWVAEITAASRYEPPRGYGTPARRCIAPPAGGYAGAYPAVTGPELDALFAPAVPVEGRRVALTMPARRGGAS